MKHLKNVSQKSMPMKAAILDLDNIQEEVEEEGGPEDGVLDRIFKAAFSFLRKG